MHQADMQVGMDDPPLYEDSEGPHSRLIPLEVEEPDGSARPSRFKSSIIIPVRHFVVDPVVTFWRAASDGVEAVVSRFMNPLLAKRLFTVIFTCIVLGIIYYFYGDEMLGQDTHNQIDPGELQAALDGYIQRDEIKHISEYFGRMPHHAGTVAQEATADYLYSLWDSQGIDDVAINSYEVLLSHPNTSTVTLYTDPPLEQVIEEGKPRDEVNLEHLAPQMALALGGHGRGNLVYANFGSGDDYDRIEAQGTSIKGKILLMRYGHEEVGVKLQRAQLKYAAGVLLFAEKHPTAKTWPDGPDYAEDAVQRGSVGIPGLYPGDILTPGWSSAMSLRLSGPSEAHNVIHIPVAPLSWKQAGPLLQALKGHGQRVDDWSNNGYPRQVEEWWTGDDSSPEVELEVDPIVEDRHMIRNVLGRIHGVEQREKAIIIGARMDAFCYGGVALSGLAVLTQVAKALAYLRYEHQWQPLRSIYFAAWDATAHNYAGSTEWTETVTEQLEEDGVIYIDLDTGAWGPEPYFCGDASIDMDEILKKIAVDDKSLWDLFEAHQSEYCVQQGFGNFMGPESHVGIPSLSLGFKGEVYPRDSCFDTLEWQQKFGDTDYKYHQALAKLTAMLAVEYADKPILPTNVDRLSREIRRYIEDAREYAVRVLGDAAAGGFDFADALDASDELARAGSKVIEWNADWSALADQVGNKLSQEPVPVSKYRMFWNDRLAEFSKHLVFRPGIKGRPWWRNLVYGSQYDPSDSSLLSGTLPGIRDAIAASDTKNLQTQISLLADHLRNAANSILAIN